MRRPSDNQPWTGAPWSSAANSSVPRPRQKLLAFGSLIVLLVFFSLRVTRLHARWTISWHPSVDRGQRCPGDSLTFVIITGGIDLSVGCLMTFCAVMAGVVLGFSHLPLWTSIVAAVGVGALCGTVSGTWSAKMKIPPFIATLGMMLVNKGLALVVSADKPIYFVDTPSFSQISQGSMIGYILPAMPIPNGVLILFFAGGRGVSRAQPHRFGTLHFCAGKQ